MGKSSRRVRRKTRCSRKAWQRAINVLLWYPDNVIEYNERISDLLARDPDASGDGSSSPRPDPTASAAIRMAENKRLQTLKQDIEAVDAVVLGMLPEHREVIRRRFWDMKWEEWERRKPRQFEFLQDFPYSISQMGNICTDTIRKVAAYLGEQ